MIVSELLEIIFQKINQEIDQIMQSQVNEVLIGDSIAAEEITINNYSMLSSNYLTAIDALLSDHQDVKFFLKNLLLILQQLGNIEIDQLPNDINFKLIDIPKSLLNGLYINNNEINNLYLFENNIAIVSTSYNQFAEYLTHLNNHDTAKVETMLYLAKAILDNLNYEKRNGNDCIVFLSNCTDVELDNYRQNTTELISYLKLCLLSEGKSFHKHYTLNDSIISSQASCDPNKKYSQYNEILYILSEYNYSNDLLNKYFLLYTIIENFMYRKPIAQMLRSSQEFSIRDFKRFYSKIDSNEGQKISELFKSILNINFGSQTFHDEIKTNIETFFNRSDINETNLISFLLKIGVSNSNGELDKNKYIDNLINTFSKTIYQLRNSILHNTATEFHITHYELSKNGIIVNFLQEFIIPMLEKIILYLIFENHELISYENNSLLLYGET
ncbi:MAG: hypothetical protein IBX44_03615 [Sulfurospirillum sp.]|nr:hypothetical protein [Sulfurospirillum sp.]